MDPKYVVAAIIIVLLLLGGVAWIFGRVSNNEKIKKLGATILGVWILLDVVFALLAIPLGWYK